MTALNKQALRERYSSQPVPKCHICGAEMTIQRAGGGSLVYGCTGRVDSDGEGYVFAEGRDFADNHYALSRVTVANDSDPDVLAMLDELEAAENELNACKSILEKIKSTSCHVDTSPGAFIPNSLDAWGRPVPQYLPYDFSGNPGVSATQYCNGWNDAGGYWLNHVKYLQECIRAAGIGVKGE